MSGSVNAVVSHMNYTKYQLLNPINQMVDNAQQQIKQSETHDFVFFPFSNFSLILRLFSQVTIQTCKHDINPDTWS